MTGGGTCPAISVQELEAVAALGWRAADQAPLGDWLLRAAGGFTGRANSALAVGDPGLPLPEAVAEVCRWYRARQLPPMVAVPYPLAGPGDSEVDAYLAGHGWHLRSGAATVMTAPPTAVLAGTDAEPVPALAHGPPPLSQARVTISPEPDAGWLARYHYRGQDPGSQPAGHVRALLASAPWQAFAAVREEGRVLAIGRVAMAGGWAGITAVDVDPAHRRRGLATAVTAALASAAASRGAVALYLQVENGNHAARALYRRAGFTDHHRYHYRIAPGETVS